jgi:hypothetical protein
MIQFSKVKYNFITPFSIIYAIHSFIINFSRCLRALAIEKK